MTTWIALFRGINVGGRNVLPMKELVSVLEKIGYTNIRTYIQSGNVVLQSRRTKPGTIAEHIAKAVFDSHGFRPRVIVLGASDLRQAIDANPFTKAEADPGSLHLYFLAKVPKHPDLEAMKEAKSASEAFVILNKVFYLHAPDGVGRSKLAARAEKLIGVDATARNWRSANKVLQLASQSA